MMARFDIAARSGAYLRNRVTEALSRSHGRDLGARLASVGELAGRVSKELFAVDDLTRFEYQVSSQNGEDGVIIEILNRIGVAERYFVEFGIQTGHEGNCVYLADVLGWSGLFVEAAAADFVQLAAKYRNTGVRAARALVTPANVNQIFTANGVPAEPDVLSIDIDGNDIWVWSAVTMCRPRLLILEYNSALNPNINRCQVFDPDGGWNHTAGYGSSLAALDAAAAAKGYQLVHTDLTGVNAFYVRDDLLSLVGVTQPPRRNMNFGLIGGGHTAGEPRLGWTSFG